MLALLCVVSLLLGLRREKQFIVSSYSAAGESDIRLMEFARNGEARVVSGTSIGNNPSYFSLSQHKTAYLVNEVDSFAGRRGGGITIMRRTNKKLGHLIGSAVNQNGGGPCYITISNDKKHLLTANYGSGSVSVVSLDLSGMPEKVTDIKFFDHPDTVASHPHMILYNKAKKLYYVTDLGLDKIFIFGFNEAEGKLVPAAVPSVDVVKGSGPRHMVINKNRKMLYVVNELNSTVSAYDIRSEVPVLKNTVSALPAGYSKESYSGDICLAPSGKYLYITNRGANTIGVFRVKGSDMSLKASVSCGGDWPRNIAVNRKGERMIVCNQRSGDLAFFRINRRTGMLIKEDYSYKLNAPSCVKFIE